MPQPNIFSFATSELSQDAFFCWLASCSLPEVDVELREVGLRFVNLLITSTGGALVKEVWSLSIERQWNHLDILIKLNDQYAILIEDKAGSLEHSEQLARYLGEARNELPDLALVPVYIQTHIQPTYEGVVASGWTVIDRKKLLGVLPINSRHAILSQYGEYLATLDTEYESYRYGKDWGFRGWQGYFADLTSRLPGGRWSYVPNPQGGFLAAYWGGAWYKSTLFYLQLGQQHLSVRIEQKAPINVEQLYQTALEYPGWTVPIKRKPRKGKTQNLVYLELEHRVFDESNNLNFEATVARLIDYTERLKQFASYLEASRLDLTPSK